MKHWRFWLIAVAIWLLPCIPLTLLGHVLALNGWGQFFLGFSWGCIAYTGLSAYYERLSDE